MWVEFIVGSLPCSKRFSSEHTSFPISLKKTHASKFQFDLESTNTFEGVLKNSQMFVGKQITILFFFLQTLMPTPQSTLQHAHITMVRTLCLMI